MGKQTVDKISAFNIWNVCKNEKVYEWLNNLEGRNKNTNYEEDAKFYKSISYDKSDIECPCNKFDCQHFCEIKGNTHKYETPYNNEAIRVAMPFAIKMAKKNKKLTAFDIERKLLLGLESSIRVMENLSAMGIVDWQYNAAEYDFDAIFEKEAEKYSKEMDRMITRHGKALVMFEKYENGQRVHISGFQKEFGLRFDTAIKRMDELVKYKFLAKTPDPDNKNSGIYTVVK